MEKRRGRSESITLASGEVVTVELISRSGSIDGKRRYRLDEETGARYGGRFVDELANGTMIVDISKAGFVGASGAIHYARPDDETPDPDCLPDTY
jgi:hypothetical protein